MTRAFFLQRVNDHVQYLKKMQATLSGQGDFQGSDCHECKLGEWLYGEGPAEAAAIGEKATAVFDSLFEPHQRFHEASREALAKKGAGDEAGAKAANTEMYQLSVALVDNCSSWTGWPARALLIPC